MSGAQQILDKYSVNLTICTSQTHYCSVQLLEYWSMLFYMEAEPSRMGTWPFRLNDFYSFSCYLTFILVAISLVGLFYLFTFSLVSTDRYCLSINMTVTLLWLPLLAIFLHLHQQIYPWVWTGAYDVQSWGEAQECIWSSRSRSWGLSSRSPHC